MTRNSKIATARSTSPEPTDGRVAFKDGRIAFSDSSFKRLTHYLFRYPAKFHPPVARHLIETFSKRGQVVFDPFCGSGTLLVEASTLDRHSIGCDIDPVAVFASAVKAVRVRPGALRQSADGLLETLELYRRSSDEYDRRQFEDYEEPTYRGLVTRFKLNVPAIPNLFHWFRKYVLVDLALLKRTIRLMRSVPDSHRAIFQLCFAATIRRASNADPVPVSGLEVTSHMKKRDKEGRVIDPFSLFEQELRRTCAAFKDYWDATSAGFNGRAFQADARRDYTSRIDGVDVIITSPPYHGAVDYYRRHTLETYWQDFAASPSDRLSLLPQYIGRAKVPQGHEYAKATAIHAPYMKHWERKMRKLDPERADAFKHYALSMQSALAQMAAVLPAGGLAVLVVGNSRCRGEEIDTPKLLAELCRQSFGVAQQYWYPVKNRYMSYSRHNGASIDREHVLVLERRRGGV